MAIRLLVFVVAALLSLSSAALAEEKFFDSNGVRIRYVDEGSGEPVILLHGFAGDLDRWRVDSQVLPTLSSNYRVIAFDSRGNGLSGKPHDAKAYGVEVAQDAIRLLGSLDPNLKLVRAMKNVMPSLQVVVIEGAAHGPSKADLRRVFAFFVSS